MADEVKQVSKYATSYKRRSGGVDKRALRGLNRTLEQKEKRKDTVNRRRTLHSTDDSLENIKEHEEEDEVEDKTMDNKKDKLKTKTEADNRKEKLERWRKEKELKKKLAAQKQKRPGFKVFHVPDVGADFKITQKLAPVKPLTAAPKVINKPTPAKTAPNKGTKTEPTRRVTRSSAKSSLPEKKPTSTRKPSTTTRQRHASGAATKMNSSHGKDTSSVTAKGSTMTATTRRLAEPGKTTRSRPTAVKPVASTSNTKKAATDPPRGAPTRTTRSTATNSKSTAAKDQSAQKRKGAASKPVRPNLVVDLENTPHVTRSRGEAVECDDARDASFSFPASKFQFKAPDNLTPFQFTPLSPSSAAGFLCPNGNPSSFTFSFSQSPSEKSRRCSTPKVSDLMKKKAVIRSPAASIIKEVDSTDSESDNDTKRRKSRTSGNIPQIQVELPSDTSLIPEDSSTRSGRKDSQTETTLGVSNVDTMYVTAASELEDDTKMEVDTATPARRCSARKSTSSSDSAAETLNDSKKSTPGRRRSTRKSITPAVETIEEETKDQKPNDVQSPETKSRRRSTRRSVSSEPQAVAVEESKDSIPTVTPGRRRSTRRSVGSVSVSSADEFEASSSGSQSDTATDVSRPVAEKTPSRKRGRSNRKSLAIAGTPRLSDIPEPIMEAEQEEVEEAVVSETDDNSLEQNVDDSSKKRKKNVVIADHNDVQGSPRKDSTPASGPKPSTDDAVFRTPASLPSNRKLLSARRKTTVGANVTAEFSTGCSKQTPRSLNRCSLVLKTLSPEEGVEVLMKSPMIEMGRKRKTPKTPRTPAHEGRIEPIDFDDLDESLNSSQSSGISSSQEAVAETVGPVSMEVDKNVNASMIQDSGISSAAATPSAEGEVVAPEVITERESDVTETATKANGVPYFKTLISATVSRLNQLSTEWEEISKAEDRLTEELQDRVRTTIGQAQLLISKKGRFTQFIKLVDDCEFERGEQKTTVEDCQGFLEMVNYQVEDVYKKFEELKELKENNWEEKELPKAAPLKKKVMKKKPALSKPTASRPSAKSKFAAFRAKMKQQQEETKPDEKVTVPGTEVPKPDTETTKTFEGGFFRVDSPVKTETESLKKLLVQNVSRSSSKPSTPKRFSKSPSCASPLLLHVISRRSRSIGVGGVISPLVAESSANNAFASPSVNPTKPATYVTNTPVQAVARSSSIFTPDSLEINRTGDTHNSGTPRTAGRGSVRRSKRLSTRIETPMQAVLDSPGGLVKYLVPSSTINTGIQNMDVDISSPGDVEMSANMKRGLLIEFDQAGSRKSISLANPAARSSSKRLSASKRRRPSFGRNRRSVHFDLNAASDNAHCVAPVTPFNKNSLVPRRRTHSGRRSSSSSEQKENLLFTPPTTLSSPMVPVSESPATRMSKLTFNANSPMNTIFTPPGSTKLAGKEPAVATLIDLNFSHEELQTDGAGHPTNNTPASSNSRASLL